MIDKSININVTIQNKIEQYLYNHKNLHTLWLSPNEFYNKLH